MANDPINKIINMLLEITLRWTFHFEHQLNKEILENWLSTNVDEATCYCTAFYIEC